MQSSHPPRPPHPPLPGPAGESDRALVARLSGPHDGRHHAVALLLARHWRATRDYAVVCLTAAGPSAHMVATAAFHQVLGGAAGGALRPRLLVAVRDTVRAWAADEVARIALPELRKTTGGRGLRATKPGPPENRQLAARAFRALPGAAQCLLWHTEVEAEPINIPAGLSGVDTATATTTLEQAREQFRAGCVRAHRELAPTKECRYYNRLLDVPIRRGGALLPDVRRHLTVCAHCRYAAEQLGLFDDALPLLLAETVLGWGARRYLDSRPGRAVREEWPPPPAPSAASPVTGGRHRTGPGHRHRKAVAIGVGLTSLVLLAGVLVVRSRSEDNRAPVPGATWGAPAGGITRPNGTGGRPATSPSAASAGAPVEVARSALRGLASGLCLDVRGDRITAGAGARLAPCSAAASQQWSYQDDGLLRSVADPTLCLAADPRTKSVALAGCVVPAGEVSYDVTVRGEILLRRHHGLALTPGSGGPGAGVEVGERDGSAKQRWVLAAGAGGTARSGAGPEGFGTGTEGFGTGTDGSGPGSDVWPEGFGAGPVGPRPARPRHAAGSARTGGGRPEASKGGAGQAPGREGAVAPREPPPPAPAQPTPDTVFADVSGMLRTVLAGSDRARAPRRHSYGGAIAFGYAVRHPGRVATLTLLWSEPATAAWAAKPGRIPRRVLTELAYSEPDALARITAHRGHNTARLARETTLGRGVPAGRVLTEARIRAVRCPVLGV
ncbi:ricin-type beta-trefoil lectin domain protein [Streptomyces sp. NRRL WC-3744]|uniref:ricin-type beta-trefoil lectin domain protein n=1 Tax=Streptomyces sp. NRRL WC-3744 TaxID=1463935 RepID=UPI00068F4372|nr:RICIN domain-containing protein [Streptomyces sp. NRRL WC-3744]